MTITIKGDLNLEDSNIVNDDDNIFPNMTTLKYKNAACFIVKGCIDKGKKS